MNVSHCSVRYVGVIILVILIQVCQVFRNSSFRPITLGVLSGALWTIESVNLFTVTYVNGEVTFDNFKR